ncbi:hypothetical protein GcM1_238051 [Golovinomyces cichoracearum]|uniref:Uncharacterized protein n=1 Tax=Golovinomyces cichoracearum TaxID=62708 RepID=A0A420IJA3_9PEZI|nr:hypothetical protein GcM1_238051 [Golovinomyces cichoracearum]
MTNRGWEGPFHLIAIQNQTCTIALPSGPTKFRTTVVRPFIRIEKLSDTETSKLEDKSDQRLGKLKHVPSTNKKKDDLDNEELRNEQLELRNQRLRRAHRLSSRFRNDEFMMNAVDEF